MRKTLFHQTVQAGIGVATVEVIGTIDDQTKFPPVETENVRMILVNLNQVDHINSAGVRGWIKWIWNIESENGQVRLVFRGVPVNMAKQIVIVSEFFSKNAAFESMYVPYFCNQCDHEQDQLIHLQRDCTKMADSKISLDVEVLCPGCNGRMAIDQSAQYMDVIQLLYEKTTLSRLGEP